MNEIERLKAELAAVERELADANAAVEAIKSGKQPEKIRRAPKPKAKPKKARPAVHHPESGLRTSIEGYGGPAPSSMSEYRASNSPVVMKHHDPMTRPVDTSYARRTRTRPSAAASRRAAGAFPTTRPG